MMNEVVKKSRKWLMVSLMFLVLFAMLPVLSFASNPANEPKEWAANTFYEVKAIVTFQGSYYECLQSHQSLTGWEPANTPAIWKKTDLLTYSQAGGRLQQEGTAVAYSWPGIYFTANFTGTGIGIRLNDWFNRYNIQIDGAFHTKLVNPGKTTYWINGLSNGQHTIKLSKVSESTWNSGRFEGLVPAEGGSLLDPPPSPARQIEFIGDSWTVGFGNLANTRECTYEQTVANTDTNLSFGVLTAGHYGADYQINGYSGTGMVRNYSGASPDINYRTYYDRALLETEGNVWNNFGDWKPQVVVIELGVNDFSTSLQPNEPYTPETLKAAYKSAYHGFIDKLRGKYGNDTDIIVSATYLWPDNVYSQYTQEIVDEEHARGDSRVHYFYFGGIGLNACLWHPDVNDHQSISNQLIGLIDQLPHGWNGIQAGETVWSPNRTYQVNDLVTYKGISYKCLQAHSAKTEWDPVHAISLWKIKV
ncbi:acetylxylan esterase [Paenibacillus sp. SYP-B3998]|uniref:Acetylxylan esterase n=1 Tax=Paenibacillus sp. SYP-B3998 TaxID=2678564 RepID=A0A6G3ZY68_9BACL|nr:carbohydrate-binding protein [Paenibacillus sp. SYP-B3998]NEW06529.1 acetylxylan esterase [Paenibacillus sp. SYP-B3998]